MPERYTPGYSESVIRFMGRRSFATHGAFFRPYLDPAMHVLDCGCGPGTITTGLARHVSRVTAVDAAPAQIARAAEEADRWAIRNIAFEPADVYELPFPDHTFDAVFSHALFEHLSDPLRALRELCRVVKPQGCLALRTPDWGGFLLGPPDEGAGRAMHLYEQIQQRNGGDLRIGRKLGALAREAGCTRVRLSASYENYEDTAFIADYIADLIEPESAASAAAMRAWGRQPAALFAQAWAELIAGPERLSSS